jgi:RHS repeat-associated protein
VRRTAGSTTTDFCFDGSSVVLEKVGTNTTANYTYGNGLLTRGGEMLHYDGHGTMRTATDATETVTATQNWYAYGQLRGSSGSTASPYRYGATSGYRNDGDGGVLHIGARWYDPAIGRWISADPHLGEIEAPLSRNRYNYCESDPVNALDPTGLYSDWNPFSWDYNFTAEDWLTIADGIDSIGNAYLGIGAAGGAASWGSGHRGHPQNNIRGMGRGRVWFVRADGVVARRPYASGSARQIFAYMLACQTRGPRM